MPIAKTLRPLIAVPTTAGTGSETTGTAILDIPSKNFKTGIANRALRPTLGIVDTRNTESCPTAVHISSGLDVVCVNLLRELFEVDDLDSFSTPWSHTPLSRTTNACHGRPTLFCVPVRCLCDRAVLALTVY